MNGAPLDHGDHSPSVPAASQWLGLRMQGQGWVVSVLSVAAVFRPLPDAEPPPARVIDVVVYGGAPVFIAPLSLLFNGSSAVFGQVDTSGPWVVVMSDSSGAQLGFRVEEVMGPFHAPIRDGRVFYSEKWWQVLQRTGETHA